MTRKSGRGLRFLSTGFGEMIVLLVILALVVAVWYRTSSTTASMRGREAVAGVFMDAVEPSLISDERFNRVTMDFYTGHGGAILVRGVVDSQRIKDELVDFLDRRFPPRALVFHLRIEDQEGPDGEQLYFSGLHRRDRHREERVAVEQY